MNYIKDNTIKSVLFLILGTILFNYLSFGIIVFVNEEFEFISKYISSISPIIKLIIIFCIQNIVFFLILYLSLKIYYSFYFFKDFIDFFKRQFIRTGFSDLLKYSFGMYFMYMLLTAGIGALLHYLDWQIPGLYGDQEVVKAINELPTDTIFHYISIFLIVTIIGPFVEEIIYRGFITNVLLKRFNAIIGIIASAFIFAFIHFERGVIRNLFIIGLFLSYIYYKTGSLIYTIAFHFLFNLVTTLVLFFGPDIEELKEKNTLNFLFTYKEISICL